VQSCPANCKFCPTDLVDCEQVFSLQEVLQGIPVMTKKILLRKGNFTIIPERTFRAFSKLQVLSISDFPLYSLANQSFATDEVSSLEMLDLSNNQLTSCWVEASSLSGLQNLKELTLTNNALTSLKKCWFSDLVKLEKLIISINKITYLPPRLFDNLAQLTQLQVASNQIRYISTDTFYGLYLLRELDLSENTIIFINKDAFNPLHKLEKLYLFKNKLAMLPDISQSTKVLQLNDNLWMCTCDLVHSIRKLKDQIENPDALFCDSPEELQERQILDIEGD
uniref:Uncharacterized protein n=1 Tax=Latimeria chalumnae TaxID=7897 RepID=H3B8J4_LATCH